MQEYSIEDKDGNEVNPQTVTDHMKENDGSPMGLPGVNDMLHIFTVRHLNNNNNPNTATNLLDYKNGDK